ncbi:MAG: ATP phosphoribosyltransferase regulatory subunit [Lachnospiraceae bacterium]|nr:ATP phosphoribosyltransferase regulatory subunit [Lachnospiraceae bacterium]
MGKQLLHTPEGVRDIYGEEYEKKLQVQSLLHQKISSYGYRDIQTPTFEFFDVFSKEIGTTPSRELYKFFDKEGNTLVLRPDFTPSIARCAAKYFMDEDMPIRFSYLGNAFTNLSDLQGKLKESTQMGVELIGDESIYADAEIISMVIESLLNAGLRDFQVSVGNAEYFKGLCQEFHFTPDLELTLREYISNKNYFGAEEYLLNENVEKAYREALLKTGDLIGTVDVLEKAEAIVNNERSLKAVKRLRELYDVLQLYGIEKYVSFDFGMLSKYQYYTGMIFKVYTYGVGDAIVKGGRYDSLLQKFGKDAPAVGFVILIDDLMQALSRQNTTVSLQNKRVVVVYEKEAFQKALTFAKERRNMGYTVEMIQKENEDCSKYEAFSARIASSELIYIKD